MLHPLWLGTRSCVTVCRSSLHAPCAAQVSRSLLLLTLLMKGHSLPWLGVLHWFQWQNQTTMMTMMTMLLLLLLMMMMLLLLLLLLLMMMMMMMMRPALKHPALDCQCACAWQLAATKVV